MNNNFDSILQFLQGLLTNKQSTQASQWGQGLGFGQQQLAQQGSQFGQSLAAQTAAQNQANALAQAQQVQSAQGQQFGEQQAAQQASIPYLSMLSQLQKMSGGATGGTPSLTAPRQTPQFPQAHLPNQNWVPSTNLAGGYYGS